MSQTASGSDPLGSLDERRERLARSALQTLGEIGYARAGLRELVAGSEFSQEVASHFFLDKIDLVVYCVRYYKASCVTRYDAVLSESTTPAELVTTFAATLVATVVDEAPMHRLWYDVRSQSMFEPGLREAAAAIDRALEEMIWRVVSRYAELGNQVTSVSPAIAYGAVDGLFQRALLGYLGGAPRALPELVEQVRVLLPMLARPGVEQPFSAQPA